MPRLGRLVKTELKRLGQEAGKEPGLDKMLLGVRPPCPFCRFCLLDQPGEGEKVLFDCCTEASRTDPALQVRRGEARPTQRCR